MITLEAYLRRDYENERECEYVDGEFIERTGGGMPHALLFTVAGAWFWKPFVTSINFALQLD